MKRVILRRWLAWAAIFSVLAQAGLPALRMAIASAGALRAEAVLATVLCSKPALSVADGIDALLGPWKQHDAKSHHQHCTACPQNIDAPAAMASRLIEFLVSKVAKLSVPDLPYVWFASAPPRVPPSRAPPVFS